MASDELAIVVTKDEALVLFEILSRYGERAPGHSDKTLTVLDSAERQALWNLLCCIERELVAPFAPDYAALLAGAKAKLTYVGGVPFEA
jgi:hypothetical protein